MADAAYEILSQDKKETGNFYIVNVFYMRRMMKF